MTKSKKSKIKDYLSQYPNSEGIIWTEFEWLKNLMVLYHRNSEFLEKETIKLISNGPEKTFYKIKVRNLKISYMLLFSELRKRDMWI